MGSEVRRMRLRSRVAIWCGKLACTMSRRLGKGSGSSLPGRVARKIDPEILSVMSGMVREKIIAVTGTNGKTTTTYLLKAMLEGALGARVGLIGTNQNMIGGEILPARFPQKAGGGIKAHPQPDQPQGEKNQPQNPQVAHLAPKALVHPISTSFPRTICCSDNSIPRPTGFVIHFLDKQRICWEKKERMRLWESRYWCRCF